MLQFVVNIRISARASVYKIPKTPTLSYLHWDQGFQHVLVYTRFLKHLPLAISIETIAERPSAIDFIKVSP